MAKKKAEAAPARGQAGAAAESAAGAGTVEYTRDGAARAGYLARPDGAGPHPAVLVVQAQWA